MNLFLVMAGPLTPEFMMENFSNGRKWKYISTEDIKPSQCYEIARRHCTGEVVVWVADDCEFPNDVLGKAYRYYKSQNNEKLILSIQTRESGYQLPVGQLFDMNMHRFFGYRVQTPLMAPLGMMNRKFLDSLGGIDRRYVCGQYENDIVMRAYNEGAAVEIFGDRNCFIDIDHLGKSLAIGESKVEADFIKRPFAMGYPHDRSILEGSWCRKEARGMVVPVIDGKHQRNDTFEPFSDVELLTKSQSFTGKWI